MTSEQMVSVSPIWQLGHVAKGADMFAVLTGFCRNAAVTVTEAPAPNLNETDGEMDLWKMRVDYWCNSHVNPHVIEE